MEIARKIEILLQDKVVKEIDSVKSFNGIDDAIKYNCTIQWIGTYQLVSFTVFFSKIFLEDENDFSIMFTITQTPRYSHIESELVKESGGIILFPKVISLSNENIRIEDLEEIIEEYATVSILLIKECILRS